jgi:phage-related tail fiber protein
MTFTANTVLTAAQLNTYVRDNLLETSVAKATTAGSIFVATGANALAERTPATDNVDTDQTTASGSFGDLGTIGPTVSITTGTSALVLLTSNCTNNTVNQYSIAGVTVSGASTVAAADADSLIFRQTSATVSQDSQASWGKLFTGLTPGTNVFTMKYRVTGGTGNFQRRRISVIPF